MENIYSDINEICLECVDTSKDTHDNEIFSGFSQTRQLKSCWGKNFVLKVQSKSSDFSEQASKLADALQRSLVIEGYSLEKAKEITIERTVEMTEPDICQMMRPCGENYTCCKEKIVLKLS